MTYNLVQLIEQSALRFPDNEAFKSLDECLTYLDLNNKSDQLAHYLIEVGVNKGDRVGIYMNRCLDYAVAVYGILKAGGVFVAVNPLLPVTRVQHLLKDCSIKHLVSIPTFETKLISISKESTLLETVVGISNDLAINTVSWESIFSISLEQFDRPKVLGKDLASILYTSGSTGTPKGIMHTHDSLVNLAYLEVKLHDAKSNDVIGNFAPLHFDQSLFGLFAGPLVGAKTIIFPDSYVKLPASLSALVAKEKVSLWFSVPAILVQVLLQGQIDKHDFSSLRLVRFGGEVFPIAQLRELMGKWKHVKFINSYGPSEIARCTYYVLKEPPRADAPIPLGTVWENTEYLILNKEDQVVEKGAIGELVVRTATMMAGYWNNKKLTERSLFKVKLAAGYNHVYYRTGDLVKENNNNELLFQGRKDRQTKIRGNRIEPGEIEAVLLEHEFVEAAAVIVIGEQNSKKIKALANPLKNEILIKNDLLKYCKERLPNYAVPDEIIIVDKIPRTSNDKVDLSKVKEILELKQND